ncbi:MAG: hypothetical protein WAM28_08315 [Chlamydiales bacterium]
MIEPYFHQVKALHKLPDLEWERLAQEMPQLPRGWFELSRLSLSDRIEFARDFWLSKLCDMASPQVLSRIENFFYNLEDIGFYVTQDKEKDPWDVHMVYSLKGATHFFHGSPPSSEAKIEGLRKGFDPLFLPSDYLVFLQIHDGFSKYTDTGVIKIKEIARIYQRFQQLFAQQQLVDVYEQAISAEAIIPFYESSRLHCYQCFYTDRSFAKAIGNIPFFENSLQEKEEHWAFPSFLDWLVFYLESSWICSNVSSRKPL